MKKDAYYFSHDANAQDDPKCMLLIDQMGMEGYGIFWALIERLRAEKDYTLPFSICGPLAKRWGTSKEKVETVVRNYNLFTLDIDVFFSIRLKKSMQLKSEKARESISYRWDNNKKDTNVYERNTDVIRIDTIKGKERKVKESKGNNLLSFGNDVNKDTYFEFLQTANKDDKNQFFMQLKTFINETHTMNPQPYGDMWNLFASKYGLSTIDKLSDKRVRKLRTRLIDTSFDFPAIMLKISKSPFYKGENGSWKVTFDYVIENDTNYLKILES